MARNVDFVFTKNWGLIKKGTVKNMDGSAARYLQDKDKVGKIKKINEDKTDKKVLAKK